MTKDTSVRSSDVPTPREKQVIRVEVRKKRTFVRRDAAVPPINEQIPSSEPAALNASEFTPVPPFHHSYAAPRHGDESCGVLAFSQR